MFETRGEPTCSPCMLTGRTGSYDGRSDSPPKQWCLHPVMVLVECRRHRLLVDGGGEEPVEFVGVDL